VSEVAEVSVLLY